jgi:hypothetical protein
MTEEKNEVQKIIKRYSRNYWALSTAILAILLVVTLLTTGEISSTISATEVGQKVLSFAKNQGTDAALVSVSDNGQFYKVILSIDGQEVPLQATKDGKNLITQLIPLETQTNSPSTSTKIPKNDKPKIEVFVMSYCPYGTQIEKGILPVVDLLGDKIDFELKFVYYAMHPTQGEVEENTRQYCIQKEQNDKFTDYLSCFLQEGDSESCITEVDVDQNMLDNCYTTADAEFDITTNLDDQSSWLSGRFPKYNVNLADNEAYGVGGSPTLVINGATIVSNEQYCGKATNCVVDSTVGRSPASLLSGICSSFNEAPEECNTELSKEQPSPGFGYSASSEATTTATCG